MHVTPIFNFDCMGLLEDIANVVFGSKPLNELPEKAEVDIGDLVAVWSSANNRLEKHDARLLQSDWSEVNSEKLAHIKNIPKTQKPIKSRILKIKSI